MSEYSPNQNNPSGIWQHIWVTLTMQALEEYSQKRYEKSYNTLKLLKTQLPPECESECKDNYEKIDKILKTQIRGYNQQNAEEIRLNYVHNQIPEPLLELMGKIRSSLYSKGWINKNFNARPINKNEPHIGMNTL